VSTLPDYPAEIRAPAGTLAGVSGFQINFSDHDIYTPGDRLSALIAMNPAALKTNLGDLMEGGVLIVNSDEFSEPNLRRAKWDHNPLEEGDTLRNYRVYPIPITTQTMEAVKEVGLGAKQAGRCKNFYALGLVFWLFERPLEPTLKWIEAKFGKVPMLAKANTLALKAGYNFGETAEIFSVRYRVPRAKLKPGRYRNITGNQATAIGLITAARLAGKPLVYGTYPITPASEILHELSYQKQFDVRTFQAEDEIAGVCSAVGAAFAGALAATGTSGPGMALKQEAIGLAVMTELPLVIINVQRGGPSTGLPTKTEQADLWQAIVGRNGECPVPVLAAQSPADCFWAAIEASRMAIKYMTPVILLTDGFLAQSSEPWRIPDADALEPIVVRHPQETNNTGQVPDFTGFLPYERDENGARPWCIPGTKDLQHRIGGLEKQHLTGAVNYEPANHQLMVELRAKKVENVVRDIPPAEAFGAQDGELLLVSWGGTFGAVRTAVETAVEEGKSVGHLHLRWLHPMPANTGEILARYKRVVACELNTGQLQMLLQSRFVREIGGLHKVQGRPFIPADIQEKINELLGTDS
ncbi:MAG: 2-oxoacid:acceptor oxidoreductase subunit alpha, partial [Planctomycetota bacterium]